MVPTSKSARAGPQSGIWNRNLKKIEGDIPCGDCQISYPSYNTARFKVLLTSLYSLSSCASDADIEDNDDGCRNSPVEGRSSNDLTNIVPSTDIAMGLRGGSSDALLSDSTHTHLENGSCSPDVAKVSGEDDFRTSSNDVSIVPNCDISNSQELRQIHSEPIEGASSDNRDLKETDITKKLLEGKVVSGMVEEITESLKGIQVSDVKTEEGPGPVRERKSLSFEEEEEVQNIANINKNTLSNSNPSLPSQSPKLSRSSSLRSSINTKSRSQVKMEARTEAMRSLAPARYQPDSHECSIQSCLNQFTAAELLTGANKFGCENCSNKAKQYKDGRCYAVISKFFKCKGVELGFHWLFFSCFVMCKSSHMATWSVLTINIDLTCIKIQTFATDLLHHWKIFR